MTFLLFNLTTSTYSFADPSTLNFQQMDSGNYIKMNLDESNFLLKQDGEGDYLVSFKSSEDGTIFAKDNDNKASKVQDGDNAYFLNDTKPFLLGKQENPGGEPTSSILELLNRCEEAGKPISAGILKGFSLKKYDFRGLEPNIVWNTIYNHNVLLQEYEADLKENSILKKFETNSIEKHDRGDLNTEFENLLSVGIERIVINPILANVESSEGKKEQISELANSVLKAISAESVLGGYSPIISEGFSGVFTNILRNKSSMNLIFKAGLKLGQSLNIAPVQLRKDPSDDYDQQTIDILYYQFFDHFYSVWAKDIRAPDKKVFNEATLALKLFFEKLQETTGIDSSSAGQSAISKVFNKFTNPERVEFWATFNQYKGEITDFIKNYMDLSAVDSNNSYMVALFTNNYAMDPNLIQNAMNYILFDPNTDFNLEMFQKTRRILI